MNFSKIYSSIRFDVYFPSSALIIRVNTSLMKRKRFGMRSYFPTQFFFVSLPRVDVLFELEKHKKFASFFELLRKFLPEERKRCLRKNWPDFALIGVFRIRRSWLKPLFESRVIFLPCFNWVKNSTLEYFLSKSFFISFKGEVLKLCLSPPRHDRKRK